MNKQLISDIGTNKVFTKDERGRLVRVVEHNEHDVISYYTAQGCSLEKSVLFNGQRIRSRIEFSAPIALRYSSFDEHYTVNACSYSGGPIPPTILRRRESRDGLISFYNIKPELISFCLSKTK